MFHTEVIAAMRGEIARFSEFIAGTTAPSDHVQLPLLNELSEQIGRLIFAQIPQFDNLSMADAAVCSDMVENRRFRVRVQW
jgi:hypothetical protein